jgi:hypothetical protein
MGEEDSERAIIIPFSGGRRLRGGGVEISGKSAL